jgi:hypothetical protein
MNALFGIGPRRKKLKSWSKRPDNWEVIVEHLIKFQAPSTIKAFNMVGNPSTIYSRLVRWKKDLDAGKVGKNFRRYHGPSPAYILLTRMKVS